jgi:D-alanyl-D-alanine carboxypeptidase
VARARARSDRGHSVGRYGTRAQIALSGQGALAELVPSLRLAAQALLRQAREPVRVTSVRRSTTRQAQLYRDYLAGKSRYPAAPPGTSYHEFGRAFDLDTSDRELARLGRIWESWGGTWGARFHDPIHFQA